MKTHRFVLVSAIAGICCAILSFVFIGNSPQVAIQHGENKSLDLERTEGASKFREALAERTRSAQMVEDVKSARSNFPLLFKIVEKLQVSLPREKQVDVDPKTLPREKQVLSSTVLDAGSFPNIATLKEGQMIGIPLPDGSSHDGRVNLVKSKSAVSARIGGSLIGLERATFSLAQINGKSQGQIRIPSLKKAYILETRQDGRLIMQEHALTDIECMGMLPKPDAPPPPTAAMIRAAASQPQAAIPLIDTRPSALAVIYLDFDGATVTDPDWNGGTTIVAAEAIYNGLPLTETHIQDVVASVAEDYAPYNVTITTDATRYANAPVGQRMRCIVTPTNFYGSGAGVAYLDSWSEAGTNYDDEVPCWCFGMYDPASMALVISHEVGHTFGLSHDGTTTQEYYLGHVSGSLSWGPIMGAPYNMTMTQWSDGNQLFTGLYRGNNFENDVAIIGNVTNNVGFRVDEAGGTTGTALASDTTTGSLDINGILTQSTDSDWYRITSHAGAYSLSVQPLAVQENVDVFFAIYDSTGALVASASPTANRGATLAGTLVAGTYYLSVSPSGDGLVYSNYGSLGAYRLSGSYTPVPSTPVIVTQPASVAAVDGSTITLSVVAVGSGGLTYQWIKDGTTPISPGGTSPTLRITGMTPAKTGNYTVRVRNASDSSLQVISDVAVVTINYRPKITTQPVSSPVLTAGANWQFQVTATGSGPLSYTWEKISKPANVIVGTDSPTLSIPNVQLSDAGSYRVKVTNMTGTVVTSSTVTLKVDSPPVFLQQPPPLLVIAQGSSGTIRTVVGGKAPFVYEWFKVAGLVETKVGTNSPNLTVRGDTAGAGTYRLKVSNSISTLLAQPATVSTDVLVEVDERPAVTDVALSPAGGSYQAGDIVTMTANVTGTATGRVFQWFKDNKPIGGAISNTLSFNPISWFDRGSYSVQVTNRVGSARSRSVVVKVSSKPLIITQPLSLVAATGGTASLSVTAGGDTPLSYQWFKDGISMAPLGKSAKLSLSKLVAGTANYFCRVSNNHPAGHTDSNTVTLTVEDAPKVTAITSNWLANKHKLAVGSSITITPTVTGAPPLNYQWFKAGKPLVGATSATLTLNPAVQADSGAYHVVVSNSTPVTSKSPSLTISVLIPPSLSFPPVSQSVTEYTKATFTLSATGSPTLKYQWQKIENFGSGDQYITLNGKTASSLTFTAATPQDAGRYRCVIQNEVGSVITPTVTLAVSPTPSSSISSFLPAKAKIGEKVLVTGVNFDFINTVNVGGKSAVFTKMSPTEILLTVPPGLTVSPATHLINLTSRAGTFSSPTRFTAFATNINDAVIDAAILTGSFVQYKGDTTTFTANDPEDLRYFNSHNSAWHWWTPTTTGSYTMTVGGNFDSIIAVYSGRPDGTLTFLELEDSSITLSETLTRNFTAGQNYVIMVSGYQLNGSRHFGSYLLQISTAASAQPQGSSPSEIAASVIATDNSQSSQALSLITDFPEAGIRLESSTKATAALWSNTEIQASRISASVQTRLQGVRTAANHRFTWVLRDQENKVLAVLFLDTSEGNLKLTDSEGTTHASGQMLTPGEEHQLEFSFSQLDQRLSVALDGVPVFVDFPVPAGSSLTELSAGWAPSTSTSGQSEMVIEGLQVKYWE